MKLTFRQKRKSAVIDINKATQELIKIYGIGDVISLRILKLKEILGLCVYGADE
jgi:hypothetical protein